MSKIQNCIKIILYGSLKISKLYLATNVVKIFRKYEFFEKKFINQ